MEITLHTLMIIIGLLLAVVHWGNNKRTSIFVILAMILFMVPLFYNLFPAIEQLIFMKTVYTDFAGMMLLFLAIFWRGK